MEGSTERGHILTTALLLFKRNPKDHLIFVKYVIWDTVDFFSDISLVVSCLSNDSIKFYGVAMLLVMVLCVFTSYAGFSRKKEKKWYEIVSLLFNMWPIAEGLILWLGRKKVGHEDRIKEYQQNVSSINNIVEGVPQCFITMRVLSFKHFSEEKRSVYLLSLKAGMTIISAVVGIFSFVTEGPVQIVLQMRYKIFLLFSITLGLGSELSNVFFTIYNLDKNNCFGHRNETQLNCSHPGGIFGELVQKSGGWVESNEVSRIVIFFQLLGPNLIFSILSAVSFTRLGAKNFLRLIATFPQLVIVPFITPFSYGIMCKSCNCSHVTKCEEPKIVFSKSFTALNFATTRIPFYLAAFFDHLKKEPEIGAPFAIILYVAETIAIVGTLFIVLKPGG